MNENEKKLLELNPIAAIRLLTGIFKEEHATTTCYFVNLICRYVEGDAEPEYVHEMLKRLGIKLI